MRPDDAAAPPDSPRRYAVILNTRWHQAALIASFFLVPGGIMGGVTLALSVLRWEGAAAVVALALLGAVLGALPVLLARRLMPPRRTVAVFSDRVEFSGMDALPFTALSGYGTDDYIKLHRHCGATLLVSHQMRHIADYAPLRQALISALENWHVTHPRSATRLRRHHFYGSTRARAVGAFLVAASVMLGVALLVVPGAPVSGAFIVLSGLLFGVRLLMSKPRLDP
ncbi:hypothetical protein IMZ29_09875 [Achromobacter sp. GG226]|uniref:hypothetical protein n=1 Tax=Verticiella alkaliphila TaxID=2779529 RepID=UPI001C0BE9A3|nr:hypothetical protein [Verticiella sp. GG226]MBU4610827.1 hypothetical protein [Verticiella sp. GG226]